MYMYSTLCYICNRADLDNAQKVPPFLDILMFNAIEDKLSHYIGNQHYVRTAISYSFHELLSSCWSVECTFIYFSLNPWESNHGDDPMGCKTSVYREKSIPIIALWCPAHDSVIMADFICLKHNNLLQLLSTLFTSCRTLRIHFRQNSQQQLSFC